LLAEAIEPYAGGDIDIEIKLGESSGPEPEDTRNPAILYGIGNIIENAVDFARGKVSVRESWSDEHVTIEIVDDGPGFSDDILDRVGEPYVTTRARRGDAATQHHEAGGLGLGLFIAKTFFERSGATLRLANLPPPGHGAVVRIRWPRAVYGTGPESAEERMRIGGDNDKLYTSRSKSLIAEPTES